MTEKTPKETTDEVLDKLAANAFDVALKICPILKSAMTGKMNIDACQAAILYAYEIGFKMGFIECNRTSREDAYDEDDVLKPLTVEDMT